jgi:protein-disulfide isomerase
MPDHNEQAAVQILEFADFECPACRLYQTVLSRVQERFGSAVSVVYFHFPIEYHRFARIAARAAECAKDEGKFWEMANSLYLNQDSLGLKQWSSLARESGIRDTVVFVACVDKTDPLLAVDSGIAIGKRIKLTGTPTIIVNGWRFPRPPSEEVLVQTVSDLLAGKNPQGKDR